MKNFRHNKKGVSPIIATLLLIVIAVAAAVVTYAFVSGFIGTATSQTSQQGSMSVDTGYVVSATNITVYVRNTGTKTETLGTVYVDNVAIAAANVNFGPASIGPNALSTIQIGGGAAWNTGTAHQVRIVANDGTPVSYSVHS